MDTNPTSVRNMQLGLDMADRVDQSFVRAHFQRMTIEYSSWLVNKIADKEADMASVSKIFLKNNQEKHEANNYEFKGGTKMIKYLLQMEPKNNQRRED